MVLTIGYYKISLTVMLKYVRKPHGPVAQQGVKFPGLKFKSF